ncbi:hypothetical protein [Breoghania sp.]|uniref:hypothetical protein n=1 Tax=Breoghania sp. TaxID=2065378 RepID=UPI002AA67287|nr:hypothetical protein [Breoghania sp.]
MDFKRNGICGPVRLAALMIGVIIAAVTSFTAGSARAADAERVELSEKLAETTITQDGITARLFMAPSPDDATMKAPQLEISVDGNTVAQVSGEASGWDTPQGTVGFFEIDPANDTPEIVFTSYSGGAHCCTQIYVMRKDETGAWQTVDFGMFDGEGGYFSDLDGDGEAELSTYDNAFLYAFDCYACSAAPLMILTEKSGQRIDVTREPKFEKAHRARLAFLNERLAESQKEFSPGFFSGWVAQKALLGEGYDAWETMKNAYRGYVDEGFESCPKDKPNCSEKEQVTLRFPAALTVFLKQQGYL